MGKYLQALKKWHKEDPTWCEMDCFMVPFNLILAMIYLATENKVIPALFLIVAAMLSARAAVKRLSKYL